MHPSRCVPSRKQKPWRNALSLQEAIKSHRTRIPLPSLNCYGNKPAHPTQRAAPTDWGHQTPGRYSPWRHLSCRRRLARPVYLRTCSPSTATPPRTFRWGRRFSICRRRSSGLSRAAGHEVATRWRISLLYQAEQQNRKSGGKWMHVNVVGATKKCVDSKALTSLFGTLFPVLLAARVCRVGCHGRLAQNCPTEEDRYGSSSTSTQK